MNNLVPLPVALPLLVAALLLAAQPVISRRVRDAVSIATALAVAGICVWLARASSERTLVYWFGDWKPRGGIALGIAFTIDPIGAGLAALSAVLVSASLLFSWRFFDEIGSLYNTLMLAFLGGMAGFCLTGDLFNLFVFFELMGTAAYALTGYKIEEKQALMGSFLFAVTNSVGAFFILIGIGLLYGRTGALNLAQIGTTLAGKPADGLVIAALALLTIGFGVKAALVPLHFWLDDAHAVAPTPVCVLFSGTMVELGLYAIARIYWTVFAGTLQPHAGAIRDVWLGFAVLTALVGALMCFAQRHLKRLLAFSTISHVGMFFTGLAMLTPTGLAGASLDVVGHGLVKGALFLAAGILLNRFESVDERYLHGRARRFHWLGIVFVLGGLALAGLPPFGTYLGKALMEHSAEKHRLFWVAPLFCLCSALTGGAVLRVAGHVFLGLGTPDVPDESTPEKEEKETQENYSQSPPVMILPAAALLALALVAGLSTTLERHAQRSCRRFTDRATYTATVLDARAPGDRTAPGSEAPTSKTSGILWGLGSTGAALALALAAIYRHHAPVVMRNSAARLGRPALTVLRSFHSGHVGDYIAWIVLATAVIGGFWAILIWGGATVP